MSLGTVLRDIWLVKKTLIIILAPIVLLPIAIIGHSKESRCAYGLSMMTVYWITESLPLACTALLPVLIFPILGVQPVKTICQNYIKDASIFGFSCLTFAIAVEKCNLHKRIALRTLLLAGSNPRWLMLGFMVPTWFMSMWMSNTATTAMMLPIAQAVLLQLHPDNQETDVEEGQELLEKRKYKKRNSPIRTNDSLAKKEQEEYIRLCKGMSLCVAYAANIGGSGSLSGTSPNLILQGQADIIFGSVGLDSGVNFVSWMIFSLPGSIISLILAWLWLSLFFMGPKKWLQWKCSSGHQLEEMLRQQYNKLGPISFAEKSVLGHFIVLIVLWLSKKPPVISGWDVFFKHKYVGDSAVAVLLCLSLFVFPSVKPKTFFFKSGIERSESVPALLDWNSVEKSYPWGVLLLIGGGYALADVCQKSGLSMMISRSLHVFVVFEPWLMNFFLTIMVSLCTEITSNTATSAILLPIMAQLAISLSINPLYLMWSACISTSFAFMLPVATPPNALVFATGHLQVKDMVMAGSVLNLLCVLVLNVGVNTWGKAYFNLGVMPPEFLLNNSTTVNETLTNFNTSLPL